MRTSAQKSPQDKSIVRLRELHVAHVARESTRQMRPFQEISMKQQRSDSQQSSSPKKPADRQPLPTQEATEQKQRAEVNEVTGRHKNDGQKDHKGAR